MTHVVETRVKAAGQFAGPIRKGNTSDSAASNRVPNPTPELEALKLRDAVLKAISDDARGLSYDLLGVLARIRTRRRIVREALRPALLEARKQLDALVRDA